MTGRFFLLQYFNTTILRLLRFSETYVEYGRRFLCLFRESLTNHSQFQIIRKIIIDAIGNVLQKYINYGSEIGIKCKRKFKKLVETQTVSFQRLILLEYDGNSN